jgi:hypothetical protein
MFCAYNAICSSALRFGCARAYGVRKELFIRIPGTSVPGYRLWRPLAGDCKPTLPSLRP